MGTIYIYILIAIPIILLYIEQSLTLRFVDDTPLVSEYTIMASFSANREGVTMMCSIPRLGETKNCEYTIYQKMITQIFLLILSIHYVHSFTN